MKIKVIDAFGTPRGEATVFWSVPDILDELEMIFPRQMTVELPTREVRAPWRLEVEF